MQPLFEHRLTLGGCATRALELEGDGPPLLLLHGYSDSADTWRLLLDRLAREERRAVALDMPGFGAADPLTPEGTILGQHDAFVNAALEEFAPDGGALLCGNSLGGCAALRAAERHDTGAVAGVVAVAPAGLDMARWFSVIQRDPVIRLLLATPVPIPKPVIRGAVSAIYERLAFRHPGKVDPRVRRTFASHFAGKEDAGRILATGRRLIPELTDCLEPERIECPVLLVWGRQDAMVYQTGAGRIVDAVQDCELVTLEDCGHCPQIEAPRRLADLVLGFGVAARSAAA